VTRGRKPRPLHVVEREGNPGHRARTEPVVLPPSDLVEPDWAYRLPGDREDAVTVRARCHELWCRLAPVLSRSIGLVAAQQALFDDYVMTVARVEQGERALSEGGMVVETRRGTVRSPWVTVLNQYRSHLRSLIGELGLSPSAAARLRRPAGLGGDEEDPFDV